MSTILIFLRYSRGREGLSRRRITVNAYLGRIPIHGPLNERLPNIWTVQIRFGRILTLLRFREASILRQEQERSEKLKRGKGERMNLGYFNARLLRRKTNK